MRARWFFEGRAEELYVGRERGLRLFYPMDGDKISWNLGCATPTPQWIPPRASGDDQVCAMHGPWD